MSGTIRCPSREDCLAHLCLAPGCFRRRQASFNEIVKTGATPLYSPRDDRFIADPSIDRRGLTGPFTPTA